MFADQCLNGIQDYCFFLACLMGELFCSPVLVLKACKRCPLPLLVEPPRLGHYGEYPHTWKQLWGTTSVNSPATHFAREQMVAGQCLTGIQDCCFFLAFLMGQLLCSSVLVLKACKRCSLLLLVEPPCLGHYREYPHAGKQLWGNLHMSWISGIIAFKTKKSNLERDLRKETDIKWVTKGNRKIPHTLF